MEGKKGDDGHAIPIYPTHFMSAQNWSSKILPLGFLFGILNRPIKTRRCSVSTLGLGLNSWSFSEILMAHIFSMDALQTVRRLTSSIISGVKAYVHPINIRTPGEALLGFPLCSSTQFSFYMFLYLDG
jgi:hypothetical protein